MVACSELNCCIKVISTAKCDPSRKMPQLVRVVITSDAKGSAEGGCAVADSVAQ